MKKIVLAILLGAIISVPAAFGQFRLDIGIDIPLAMGITYEGDVIDSGVTDFLTSHILPFPELGAHYFFKAGPVNIGLGARGYTFILESVLWTNAIVELEIARFVFEGQFGGGAFLFFGLLNHGDTAAIFLPDISVWYKAGNTFRLGAGLLGLMAPESDFEGVPFVFYVGGKAAIKF